MPKEEPQAGPEGGPKQARSAQDSHQGPKDSQNNILENLKIDWQFLLCFMVRTNKRMGPHQALFDE